MKKQFDLEQQFEKYLELVGLKGKQLPTIQYAETKRAFFGGCGQMLILLRNDVGAIESEDKAIDVMEDMLNQVNNFWLSQQSKQN